MIIKTLFLVGEDMPDPNDDTMYFPGNTEYMTTDVREFAPDAVMVYHPHEGEAVSFSMDEVKAMHKFLGDVIYDERGDW